MILNWQLSLAVVPLVMFTSGRRQMGRFANGRGLKAVAWIMVVGIALLNVYLIWQTAVGG